MARVADRVVVVVVLALAAVCTVAVTGATGYTTPPARDTEPVILTGRDFADWSARSNTTVKLPFTDLKDCQTFDDRCAHNHYADPELDSQRFASQRGTSIGRLIGYRWDAKRRRFLQIPFQVDEMFTRYLDNSASGFSVYSGEDQHTTYAFDREGFRYRKSDPSNPCLARADGPLAEDPVRGLDDNDELAFMASDAGSRAPANATLPGGIESVREVTVSDPTNPSAEPSYAYVMKAKTKRGARAAFDASNGYVSYRRDANADLFERSISSYDSYGNAPKGPYCDKNGHLVLKNGRPDSDKRRPRDYARVLTPRYRFRYDGRWLLSELRISADGGRSFGPDVIDRWKARAFQQDPSSDTPCCGYEEEDTNWGGSSTLMGERVGPVRAIRETWGADSGTNVVRRETFYRAELRQKSFLRVHVIPPLDGIYAQWDFNAGRMTRFYNVRRPDGVTVDGRNDEMFGNLDDPCNDNYDANATGQLDQGYRSFYRSVLLCKASPYHQSIDISDPTFADANAALSWSETAGPFGTIVDRTQVDKATDLTPGGAAQSVAAVPYYRDDSCFDDGTGTDPGPKLHLRSGDEPRTAPSDGSARKCWTPQNGIPNGSDHFFQGSIGTHGLHLLFLVESDNARQTIPVDEIVAEQRMVVLPGNPGNVGERYGRGFEKPLIASNASYRGRQPPPGTPPDRSRGRGFLGSPGSDLGSPAPRCRDRLAPRSRISRHTLRLSRRGFSLRGRSRDLGCGGRGRVARVRVAVTRKVRGGCRFLRRDRRFSTRRSCRRRVFSFRARVRYSARRQASRFSLRRRVKLPAGAYDFTVYGVDPLGHAERRGRRHVRTRLR
jgi:hypothetical protein